MLKVFLAALILIGFGVLIMCVKILLVKGGEFPQSDVGSNEALREKGIRCFKEEDQEMWDKKLGKDRSTRCGGEFNSAACKNCGFFEAEKKLRGLD